MPLNRVYTPHMHRGVGRTRQRALFIGRSAERDRLATLGAGPSEPHVVLVRGEAGVGKTSLLRVASWDLEEQGHTVLWLLGGHVPPNPEALTDHLARAMRLAGRDVTDPWKALGSGERADVLVVDGAEQLWHSLEWMFGEALTRSAGPVLVVLASRGSPPTAVRALLGTHGTVSELRLSDLTRDELATAMTARGIPLTHLDAFERGSRGNPLAFTLAAEQFARTGVVPQPKSEDDPWLALSQEFLRNATSAEEADALRAASLTRILDEPLLAAMLAKRDAHTPYRFLADLSFVDETHRGLMLHSVVRNSLFAQLEASAPDRLSLLAGRAIEHLVERAANADLQTAYELFFETFYVGRATNRASASFFWEGVRRRGVRKARAEDLRWIRPQIERFEGRASLESFDRVHALQSERVYVVANDEDESEAVIACVDLSALPAAVVDADPGLRAAARAFPDGRCLVLRWWFARDTYQAFGPAMTSLMCAGPPLTMKLGPMRYTVVLVADPDRWEPLAEPFGLARAPSLEVREPGFERGGFVGELDRITNPHASWAQRTRQLFSLHARGFAALAQNAPLAELDHEAFHDAVRGALPVLRRPLELAESELLTTALVRHAPHPVQELEAVLRGGIAELKGIAGYAADGELLEAAFLGPPTKQEAVAAALRIPFGTFRHRLRRAIARLAEHLHRRELERRSGGDAG
jgi:hypothetical protein